MKSLSLMTALGLLSAGTVSAQIAGIALVNDAAGSQNLYTFDPSSPAMGSSLTISGLGAGEMLLGIDVRPQTNELYGLSSGSAIYTLDLSSGLATIVGTGFTDLLSGTNFGFDFNPAIDKIRIVSDADQNLVAHPDTGEANVAGTNPVAYGAGDPNEGVDPNVVHHAYDGNIADSPATQLRAIDFTLNTLVTQANNAGTLGTIGPLGFDVPETGGFDVDAMGNGWAAFSNATGESNFYSIDLMTGAASQMGSIPGEVGGLTTMAIPEPSVIGLIGIFSVFGLLATGRRRNHA